MLIIAHRGASQFLPDNTILSFDQAIAEKADMIECDVRQTSDGRLVLFHDKYIYNRPGQFDQFGASRMVSHFSYDELASYGIYNGFSVLTFEEMLERYAGRIDLNIEIKDSGFEREVVNLVKQYGISGSVVLSSFMPWVMRKINSLDSSLKTGWIVGREQAFKVNHLGRMLLGRIFKATGASSAHLHYEMVIPEIIELFHERDIPVYTWTVNSEEQMKYLIKLGVDGIITNKPGVLYKVVNDEAVFDEPDRAIYT